MGVGTQGFPPAQQQGGFPSSSLALGPSVTYKFSSFLYKMIC